MFLTKRLGVLTRAGWFLVGFNISRGLHRTSTYHFFCGLNCW